MAAPISKDAMKCIECKAEIKTGHWECAPGVKHVTEIKRYFTDDAPTVPEWRNGTPFVNKAIARTQILNMPPEKQVRENDELVRLPGGSVELVRGMYETSDPEIQFWMDKKGGWCTEERWKEVYLNDDEKNQIRTMELNAREARLSNRENDLLAQTKQKHGTAA